MGATQVSASWDNLLYVSQSCDWVSNRALFLVRGGGWGCLGAWVMAYILRVGLVPTGLGLP